MNIPGGLFFLRCEDQITQLLCPVLEDCGTLSQTELLHGIKVYLDHFSDYWIILERYVPDDLELM